ncbi:uncharacterized protein KY384_007089 [Bacidia gigantensis]|uniref:uncharacterized protein n=1 Tax=Bacidia gigantensis TaxID=2732470 RepID=UPI001D05392B|nr:uncharacterized protein KY384_007089 [Bacidia gigantensis]KAG8528172.1 hypothetical protein KY384_007089 [Bacidia gigantensis]
MPARSTLTTFIFVAVALISFSLLVFTPRSTLPSLGRFHKYQTSKSHGKSPAPTGNSQGSSHAYVAFLQDHWTHENTTSDEDDEYFVATRVLAYQLMHAPKTKANASIPLVVACTPRVKESKKERLAKDGAMIVDVDYVENPEWITSKNGLQQRYMTQMTKLRIMQLTQFERVLYIDSDVYITDRMDGIFKDDSTKVQETNLDLIEDQDKGKVPKQYAFAGQAQQHDWTHQYPPDPNEPLFGAGFFLFQPSLELFDYYMHLLYHEPPRFDASMFEQNLMNYAHRRDGPMPWQDLYYKWTTSFPTLDDLNAGAKSLHHKFWWEDTNIPDHGLNKMTAMWYQTRGEMEGYYYALDEAASKKT